MSTQQSLIRVKTSKNPWNKKKNPQPTTNNTNKASQTKSASPKTDTDQWPHLKHPSNASIAITSPNKPSDAITSPSPTKPIRTTSSNHNNTASSSPNIKYKSNQDTLCNDVKPTSNATESNGHHTNTISTVLPSKEAPNTTQEDIKVSSSDVAESNQECLNSNSNSNNSKRKRKRTKSKKKLNAKASDNGDMASNSVDDESKEPGSCCKSVSTPGASNVCISTSPKSKETHPKNGYVLSPIHRDVAPRSYNNNNNSNYGYRRTNRGRRRGRGGGSGGYRNYHQNEDDEYRSYRGKQHYRGSGAPRHNKDRYRNDNYYDNYQNQNENHKWNNYANNHNMIEGEERKSDGTATATATGTGTAPTPALIVAPLYNPYTLNMNMNMNIWNMNMFNSGEPSLDTLHLMVNQLTSPPAWTGEVGLPPGPYFVLKVSCVATGYSADDRSVGHIALIDWNLKTKANIFVKPDEDIVSYISPLTSLNAELLDKYGYNLSAAINIIRSELPSNAVIIGQNITMDIEWLGLKTNRDFKTFIDLRDIWRSWSEYYKSYTHYSLSHQSKCILNVENAYQQKHSASFDAITTMKLFQYYMYCRYYNMSLFHNKISVLQSTIIEASFAKKHPVFEGVQMQSKKYKGVPYITANPKKIKVSTSTETETPI